MPMKVSRLMLTLIVIAAVATLLILPVTRYDWMQQMDPAIKPGDIQDASQNSRVAAGFCACVGVLAAMLVGVLGRNVTARLLAIVAAIVVATVWFVKFAG